jgi:hypothetical protein
LSGDSVQARNLIVEIARCPIAMQALTDLTYKTDCREIIETQRARGLDRFQSPEPWSGHIEQARVLFISSNPSIGEGSIDDGLDYPRRWWADNDISLYFDERFGTTIFDGAYIDPGHSYAVRYWSGTKRRAWELFQREPVYGVEYALTEIVHCKSKNEVGVASATRTCANQWLDRVLAIAAADVIVVMGAVARDTMRSRLSIPSSDKTIWPTTIADRPRYIAFLPSPSAFGKQTFLQCMPENDLQTLRTFLREQEEGRTGKRGSDAQKDPHPDVLVRYLRLLDNGKGRGMIGYLATQKGKYLLGRGAEPSVGHALLAGAEHCQSTEVTGDVADRAKTFVSSYSGYVQNQEDHERERGASSFMRRYGQFIAPYTGPRSRQEGN